MKCKINESHFINDHHQDKKVVFGNTLNPKATVSLNDIIINDLKLESTLIDIQVNNTIILRNRDEDVVFRRDWSSQV